MIDVSVIDGTPFVWKNEDASELREKHRIVGTLVGCLARCPTQNNHLGLPLQLMPEEARLLADKGICCLVDGKQKRPTPSQEEIEEHDRLESEIYEKQNTLHIQYRRREIYRRRQEILDGKRKKRKLVEGAANMDDRDHNDEELEQQTLDAISNDEVLSLARNKACVVMQTASVCPPTKPYEWDFPQSTQEKLRCRVFRHLWEEGYYLTTGGKFGGDFLCYPGDPSRFHAFYVVVCIPGDVALTGREISSYGRLANTVNKTMLLCSEDADGELCVKSLQWAGIS